MKEYKSHIKEKVHPVDVIKRCKGGKPKPKFLYLLKLYEVLSEGKQCNTLIAILECVLARESQEMKRFLETSKIVNEDEEEDAVAVAFEELFGIVVKMAGPHSIVAVSPQYLYDNYVGKCTVRSSNGDMKSVEWSDRKSDSAARDSSFELSRRNPARLICSFAQSLEISIAARFITRFSENMCTMICGSDLSEDVQEQAVVLWSLVVYELGLLPLNDQPRDGEVDLDVGYVSETVFTRFLFGEVLKLFQRLHQQSAQETTLSYGDRSKQLLLSILTNLLSSDHGLADLKRLAHITQALEQVFPLLLPDAASAVEERLLVLAREHLGARQLERFRTDLSVLLLLYSKSTNVRRYTDTKDDLFVTFAKIGSDQCKGEVLSLLQEELKHRPQVFTSLLTGAVQYLSGNNQLPDTFLQLLTIAQNLHPLRSLASHDRNSLLEASDAILKLLKGSSSILSDDGLDLLLSMAIEMLSCPDVVVSELVSSDTLNVFAALLDRRPNEATACILTVIAEHRHDRLTLLQTAIDNRSISVNDLIECDVSAKTFTEILRDSAAVSLRKESPDYLGDVLIKRLLKQLDTSEALTSAQRTKMTCLLQVLSDKDLGKQIIDTPKPLCFSDYVRAAGRTVCQSLARFSARNLRCSPSETDPSETDSCLAWELLFRLCDVDEKRTKDSLSRVFPTVPLPSSKSSLGIVSRSDVHEELLELFFSSPRSSSGTDTSVVVTQDQFSTMSKKLSEICDTAEKWKEHEVVVPYPRSRKGVTGENKVEVFGEVYNEVTPPPEFESHIPARPLTHVPSTKANVAFVLQSQDEGFPLLIEGQTGVGKSAAVMEAARLLNRPLVRFNLSSSVTCGDIIGRVSLSSDSNGLLKYEKGPFTKAFESGLWLLLDELNLASDDILQCIESALDTDLMCIDDPSSSENSSIIKKHENFRLFATQNPHTGSFRGTRSSLSSAFVSRFHTVSFQPPSNEDLEAIVTDVLISATTSRNRECPENVKVVAKAKQWASRMVTFHYKLSMVKMESEKNQPYAEITVRDLMKWASGMCGVFNSASTNKDLSQEQVNEWFVFEARCAYEIRFRDAGTRKAIQQALLDPNAFGFKGFQAEPPLSVEYQQETRSQAEELSIRPCVAYDDFEADHLTDDQLSTMLRFHRKFTYRIMKKSGGILYCPLLVHQWNTKCEDTGRKTILTTGFELYARYLPSCFHNDLKEMLKEHWDVVGVDIKFKNVEPEVVTPFVVTDSVKKTWMYILHALKQHQPVLVVGPEGCGKSDMILWLACLLGKQLNSWCLTSDTETSDLVGKIVLKKPAEWMDGVVTKSVKDGEWLLLDNVNEAEPAVLERLNPLLEQKPMWVLTEKGETENIFDSYVTEDGQTPFRFLATMTAPTSCRDVLKLSPALANRLTVVSVTDFVFAEGPTRSLSALLLYHDNPRTVLDEKRIRSSPIIKIIKALEKFLLGVLRRSEISPWKGLSVSLRTFVRIILGAHQIHKKFKDKCSLAQALVTACEMCVLHQIEDKKGSDHRIISEMFQCLTREIAASERLLEIKPFDFVTDSLLGQSEYALDRVKTPYRCHYANVVLYSFYTKQAVLLEGPAATGKTSLVEFIGRKLKMGSAGILYRTINSESTSIQDYFGTFIPCGDGNFAELQGPLTAAVSEGAFFLSDEFNLAEPSVLNALFPLLEGRRSITNPVSGNHIDVKEGFLFFATQNSASYADRKQLSPSLRNRFLQMQVSDFAPGELAFILQTRKFSSKVPFRSEKDTTLLEETFRAINKQIECRAVMFGTNSTVGLTVRDLIKWIERFIALSRRRDNEGGVVSLAAAGLAMLAPKLKPVLPLQRSSRRETVTVLTEAMLTAGLPDVPQRIQKPNIIVQDGNCLLFDGITSSALSLKCDNETVQRVSKRSNPEQYKRAFAQAHVALQCLEPVLLIGPTTFKSKLARDYLDTRGTDRFVVIQLSSDTQVGDLIGQIHPYQFDAAVSNLITTAGQLCERLKRCKLDGDSRFALDEAYEKLNTCREVLKTKIKPTAAGYTVHEDDPMECLILQETITSKAREETEAEIFNHESDFDDLSSDGDGIGTVDSFQGLFNTGDSEDDDYFAFDDNCEPSCNDEPNGEPSSQMVVIEPESKKLSIDSELPNNGEIFGNQTHDLKHEPVTQFIEGTEISETSILTPSDSDSDDYIPLEDEDGASVKDTTVLELSGEIGMRRSVRTFRFNSGDCFHDVSKLLSKAMEGLNDETTEFLMRKYLSTFTLLKQASTNVERPVFLFRDGPVTRAVKEGMSIIFEDINLPSQAVIERLNSLFEASRVLCLSEDVSASIVTPLLDDSSQTSPALKPGNNAVALVTDSCLFATIHINDLSEKICLSPSLRSRFSEILLGEISPDEIAEVCEDYCRNSEHLRAFSRRIRESLSAVQGSLLNAGYFQLTLKESVTWMKMMEGLASTLKESEGTFNWMELFLVTARFVLLDPTPPAKRSVVGNAFLNSLGLEISEKEGSGVVVERVSDTTQTLNVSEEQLLWFYRGQSVSLGRSTVCDIPDVFKVLNRCIKLRDLPIAAKINQRLEGALDDSILEERFDFTLTQTSLSNIARILASMASDLPLLLEGPPGIGKTAVVVQCAKLLGYEVERINFTKDTSVDTLIGKYIPRMDENGGHLVFTWQDGRALEAYMNGHFLLLDEINLASQEVLDELKSIIDPAIRSYTVRGESKPFNRHGDFRVFATMNPASVGGGRGRLPQSIESMFMKVHLQRYSMEEETQICIDRFASTGLIGGEGSVLGEKELSSLISLHQTVKRLVECKGVGKQGGPYDFNVRDLLKAKDVIKGNLFSLLSHLELNETDIESSDVRQAFLSDIARIGALRTSCELVYGKRFLSLEDQEKVTKVVDDVFVPPTTVVPDVTVDVHRPRSVRIGFAYLSKGDYNSPFAPLLQTASLNRYLQLLASAVLSGRVVFLQGPTCSRKTSLVCELSRICCRKLHIIPLSEDTETDRLIGRWSPCQSAAIPQARLEKCFSIFTDSLKCFLSLGLTFSPSDVRCQLLDQLCTLLEKFHEAEEQKNCYLLSESVEILWNAFEVVSVSNEDRQIENKPAIQAQLRKEQRLLNDCLETIRQYDQSGSDDAKGFHFVESSLVEALRKGEWVLLDNLSAAPSDVVERILSLAETPQTLHLFESPRNEILSCDGGIEADFRLFATVNSSRDGQNMLSSALLNRVISLWLPALDADALVNSRHAHFRGVWTGTELYDIVVRRMAEVPASLALAKVLIKLHCRLSDMWRQGRLETVGRVEFTGRTALRTSQRVVQLYRRRAPPVKALVAAVGEHYVKCCSKHCQSVAMKVLVKELDNSFSKYELQQSPAAVTPKETENVQGKSILISLCRKTLSDLFCFIIGFLCYQLRFVCRTPKTADVSAAVAFTKRIIQKSLKLTAQTDDLKAHVSRLDTAVARAELADGMEKAGPFRILVEALQEYGVALGKTTGSDVPCKAVSVEDLREHSDVLKSNLLALGETVEIFLKKSSFSCAQDHLNFSVKLFDCLKAAQEVIRHSGWLSSFTSQRKVESTSGAQYLCESLQTVETAVVNCSQQLSVLQTTGIFLRHLDKVCENLYNSDGSDTGVCGTVLHRILEEEILVSCDRNRLIEYLNGHKMLPTKSLAQMKLLFAVIDLLVSTSSSVPYKLREVNLVDDDDFSQIINELSVVECSHYMCGQLLHLCTKALRPVLTESRNFRTEVKRLEGLGDKGSDQQQRLQTSVKRSIGIIEHLSSEFVRSRETVLDTEEAKYLSCSYQQDLRTQHYLIFRELAALKACTEDRHESYRLLLQSLRPQELTKSVGPLWILVFSELHSHIWSGPGKLSWEVCLVTSEPDLNSELAQRTSLEQLIVFVSDDNTVNSIFGMVIVDSSPNSKALVFCSGPPDSYRETLLTSVVEFVEERRKTRKAMWISVAAEAVLESSSYQQIAQFLPAISLKTWNVNERRQNIVIGTDELRQSSQSFSDQCQRLCSSLRQFPERLVRHQLLRVASCMQALYRLPVGSADVSGTDWVDVEKKASTFEQNVSDLKKRLEGDLYTRKSTVIPSQPHQRQQFLMKVEVDLGRHLGRLSRNDVEYSPCPRAIRLLSMIKETATDMAEFQKWKLVVAVVRALTLTTAVIAEGIVLATGVKSSNWSLGDKRGPLRNCLKIGDHEDGLEFLIRRCRDMKSHCTDVFAIFEHFDEGTVDIALDYDRLRTELESSKAVVTDICQALAKCDIELDLVDGRDCIDALTQVIGRCYPPQKGTEKKEEAPSTFSIEYRKEMERQLEFFLSDLTNLYHSVCGVEPSPVALRVSMARDIREATRQLKSVQNEDEEDYYDFMKPEALKRLAEKYKDEVDSQLALDRRGERGKVANSFEQIAQREELQDINVSLDKTKPMSRTPQDIRYQGNLEALVKEAESTYQKDTFEELVKLTTKLDSLVSLSIADNNWNFIYSEAEELCNFLRSETEDEGLSSRDRQTVLADLIAAQDRSKQHIVITQKLLASSSLSVSDMDDLASTLLCILLQMRCDHHLSGVFHDCPNSFAVLQTLCKPVVKHTTVGQRGTLLNVEVIVDICRKRCMTFEHCRNDTMRLSPFPVRMADLHFGVVESDTVGCKHFLGCERQMEQDLRFLGPLSKPHLLAAVATETRFSCPSGLSDFFSEEQNIENIWDNVRDFHLKSMEGFVEAFNDFFCEYNAGDAQIIRSCYRSLSEVPEYTIIVGVVGVCSCLWIINGLSGKMRDGSWDFTPLVHLCNEEQQRQEDIQRIDKVFLKQRNELEISYKREQSSVSKSSAINKEEMLKSLKKEHSKKMKELQAKGDISLPEQLETAHRFRLRAFLSELSNWLEKAGKAMEEYLKKLVVIWCNVGGVRMPQSFKSSFVVDKQCLDGNLPFIAYLTEAALKYSHSRQNSKDLSEPSPELGSTFLPDSIPFEQAVASLLSFFQIHCSVETPFSKRLQRLIQLLSACAGSLCSGVGDIERKRVGLHQYHSTSVLHKLCDESKRFATRLEEVCDELFKQCTRPRSELEVVCSKSQAALKLIRDLRDGGISISYSRLLHEVLVHTSNMVMKLLVLVLLFVERREKCPSEMHPLRLAIKRLDPIMMEEYSSRALETELKTAYKHVRSTVQQLHRPLETLLFDFVGDFYPVAMTDASVAKRREDHASASVYGQALGRKLTWFLKIPQASETEVKDIEESLKCLQAILNQTVSFEGLLVQHHDEDKMSLSISFEECYKLAEKVQSLCDRFMSCRHEIGEASQAAMGNAKLFVRQLYRILLGHHIRQFRRCSQRKLLPESTKVDEQSLQLGSFIDFPRVVELNEIVFSRNSVFSSVRLYASFLFECILATGELLGRHILEMPIAPAGLPYIPEVMNSFVNVQSTCTKVFAMPFATTILTEDLDLPSHLGTDAASQQGINDIVPAILQYDSELWKTCRHHVCLWLKKYVSESTGDRDKHSDMFKEMKRFTAIWKGSLDKVYSEAEANIRELQGNNGLKRFFGRFVNFARSLLPGTEKLDVEKVKEYLDRKKETEKVLQEACKCTGRLLHAHPNNQSTVYRYVQLLPDLVSAIGVYNDILLQKEGRQFAELFDVGAVQDFNSCPRSVDISFSLRQTNDSKILFTVLHPSVEADDKTTSDGRLEEPLQTTMCIVLSDEDIRNLKLLFTTEECNTQIQMLKLPSQICDTILAISTPQTYKDDIPLQVHGIEVTISLSCKFQFNIEVTFERNMPKHCPTCFDSCCAKLFQLVSETGNFDARQWNAYPDISGALSKWKDGKAYRMQKTVLDSWTANQSARGGACKTLTELVQKTSLAKTNAERTVEQLNTMTFNDYAFHFTRISSLLSDKGVLDAVKAAQQHLNNIEKCTIPQCSLFLPRRQLSDELSFALTSLANLCRCSQDLASQNYAIAAIVRGGLALLCTLTARGREEFSLCQHFMKTANPATWLKELPRIWSVDNSNFLYASKLANALLFQAQYVAKARSSCNEAAAKLRAVKVDAEIPHLQNQVLLKCRREPSLHLYPTDSGFQLSSCFLNLRLSSVSSDQWSPGTKLTIFNHSDIYDADYEFETSAGNDTFAIDPVKGVIQRSQHRIVTISFTEKQLRDGRNETTDMKLLTGLTVGRRNTDCSGNRTICRSQVAVLVTGRLQRIDDQLQIYPQRVQFGPLRTGSGSQRKWILVKNNSENLVTVSATVLYRDETKRDIADLFCTIDDDKKQKTTAKDPLRLSLEALSSMRISLRCTAGELPGRMDASLRFQFPSGKEETVTVKCLVAKLRFVLCRPISQMSVILSSENAKQQTVAFTTKATSNVQDDTILVLNTGVVPVSLSETVECESAYNVRRKSPATAVLLPRASMELKVMNQESKCAHTHTARNFNCAGQVFNVSLPELRSHAYCHAAFKLQRNPVCLPLLSVARREHKRPSSADEPFGLMKLKELLLAQPLCITLSLTNKNVTSVDVRLRSVDERLLFMDSKVEIAGLSSREVTCKFQPSTAALFSFSVAVEIYVRPGLARTMMCNSNPQIVPVDVEVNVPVRAELTFEQPEGQEALSFLVMDRCTGSETTEHRIILQLHGQGATSTKCKIHADTVNCSICMRSLGTLEEIPLPWTGSLSTRRETRMVEVRERDLNRGKVVGCAIRIVNVDGYTIVSGEVVPAESILYLVDKSSLVTRSREEGRCQEIVKTVDESFSILRKSLMEVTTDQRKAAIEVVNAILNRFPFSNEGVLSEQQLRASVMQAAERGDLLAVSNVFVDSSCPVDISEPLRILSTTQDSGLLNSVLCTLSSLQSIRISLGLEEGFYDAVSESLVLPKARSWPQHWGLIHKFISALNFLIRSLQWNHSTTTTLKGLLQFLSTLTKVCEDLPSVCPVETRRRISLTRLTKCQWYRDATIHAVAEAAVNIYCFQGSTIHEIIGALQPLIDGKRVALCRLESALRLSLEPCDILNIARQLKQDLTEANNNSERLLDSLSRALNSNPFECLSFESLQGLLYDLVSLCDLPDFSTWVKTTMSSVVILLTTQKPADRSQLGEILSDLLDGAAFDEENKSLSKKIVSNLMDVWQRDTKTTLTHTKAAVTLISLFLEGICSEATNCVKAFGSVVKCLISASKTSTASSSIQQRLSSTLRRTTILLGSTSLRDITTAARTVIESFQLSSSVGNVLPSLFKIVRVIVKSSGEDPSDSLNQFQECVYNVTGLSDKGQGHLPLLTGIFGVAQMIFQSRCQESSQAVEKRLRYLIMCLESFHSQHMKDEGNHLEDVDKETELLGNEFYDEHEHASGYARYSLSKDFFSLARCIILLGSRRKQGVYERVVTKCRFLCSAEFPRLVGQCFASPLPTLASAMVDVLALVVENNVEAKLRSTAECIGRLIESRLQFRRQVISNLLSFGLVTELDCSSLQEDLDVSLCMLSRVNQKLYPASQLRCLGSQDTNTAEETREIVRIALADTEWYDVSLSNYFRFISRLYHISDGERLSSTAEELYSIALKRLTCLPGQRDDSALSDAAGLIYSIRDMIPRSSTSTDFHQLLDGVAELISRTGRWNSGQGSLLCATEVLQTVLAISNLQSKVELWTDVLVLFQEVSTQTKSYAGDSIRSCYELRLNPKDSFNFPSSFWENVNRQCDEIKDNAGDSVRSSWKHLVIFLKELGSFTPNERHTCACLVDVLNSVFSACKIIDIQSVVALIESVKRLIHPIDARASSTLCKVVSLLQTVDEGCSSWEQNLRTLMEEKQEMVDCLFRLLNNLSSDKNIVLSDALSYCSHLAMECGASLDFQKQEIFNEILLVCDELISNPECGWQDIRRLIDILFSLFDPGSGFTLSSGQTLSSQMIMSILDALDVCWHSETSDHEDEGRQCRIFSLSAVVLYELALYVAVMMKVPTVCQSEGSSPEADVTAGLGVDQGLRSHLVDNDRQEEQQLRKNSRKKADLRKSEKTEVTEREFDTLMGEFEEMFRRPSTGRLQSGRRKDSNEESASDGMIARQLSQDRSADADENSDDTDFLSVQGGVLSFNEPPYFQVLLL